MAPLVLAGRFQQCRLTFRRDRWKNMLRVSSARACSGCPAPSILVSSQITGNSPVPFPPGMTRVMEANSCQISFSCRDLNCVKIQLKKEIFMCEDTFGVCCCLTQEIWTLVYWQSGCWNVLCVMEPLLYSVSSQFSKHHGPSVRHGLWLGPA